MAFVASSRRCVRPYFLDPSLGNAGDGVSHRNWRPTLWNLCNLRRFERIVARVIIYQPNNSLPVRAACGRLRKTIEYSMRVHRIAASENTRQVLNAKAATEATPML